MQRLISFFQEPQDDWPGPASLDAPEPEPGEAPCHLFHTRVQLAPGETYFLMRNYQRFGCRVSGYSSAKAFIDCDLQQSRVGPLDVAEHPGRV